MATHLAPQAGHTGVPAVRFESPEDHVERLRARISCLQGELMRARNPWMTRAEVAEYLRVHITYVDRLIAAGRLKRHKIGANTLLAREEVEELVA